MAYYGGIRAESRSKIQALEMKFYREIQELAVELPDVTAKKIQQLIFEDMRMKKPTKPRVPTFYNYYISEESKKCEDSF